MERGYSYLQPKYMENFKCDAKKCSFNCCCRDWQIVIDENTYKKYSQAETSVHEITSHISWDEEEKVFLIDRGGETACPFLRDDGLCKLQREHGEEFLSETCLSYPRQLYNFGEIIERSLTLTCPVAAELILQSSERLQFEQTPVKLPEWMHGNLTVSDKKIPEDFFIHILEIQFTAISILQERRLAIDERLIVLGYYFYQVESMQKEKKLELIPTLNKIYTSEEFFNEQVPLLLDSVKFQVLEFTELFFLKVLGKIYGGDSVRKTDYNTKYIDILCEAMRIRFENINDFTAHELAENFYDLEEIRKVFVKDYSKVFENYLVNEIFSGVYPWKIDGTIQHNYAVLLVTFKIIELIGLSMTALNRKNEIILRKEIIKMISDVSVDLDHNAEYLKSIADSVENKSDITILMRSLLITN